MLIIKLRFSSERAYSALQCKVTFILYCAEPDPLQLPPLQLGHCHVGPTRAGPTRSDSTARRPTAAEPRPHDRIRPERYARSYTQRVIICAVAVASNQITKKADGGLGLGGETRRARGAHITWLVDFDGDGANRTQPNPRLFCSGNHHLIPNQY